MAARVYTKGGIQYLDSWPVGSSHTTIDLTALRKSAVLVYEASWQDRLREHLEAAGDYSEYLPRSKQTIH